MTLMWKRCFRRFIRRGRAAGVQLFTSARLGVPRWHHGAWHVPLGQQEIEGRVVINAAGAWADQVAGLFGVRPLGLQALRRCAAVIDAPPGGRCRLAGRVRFR